MQYVHGTVGLPAEMVQKSSGENQNQINISEDISITLFAGRRGRNDAKIRELLSSSMAHSIYQINALYNSDFVAGGGNSVA
jgi:hypothetical protein